MTRTFRSSHEPAAPPGRPSRPTPGERALVLGGFAVAALATAPALLPGGGLEAVAALWLAAAVRAFIASLALALRRGLGNRDWSAFRRCELPDDNDTLDWSLKSGAYVDMAIAEQHERLMRGD